MASFFYFVGRADDKATVIDRLASRYSWTYRDILDLDLVTLAMVDEKAVEETRRDRVRAQWVALLPFMSLEMLVAQSFDEYYQQATGGNIDLRPASAILAEVDEVRKELGVENGTV